MRIIDWSSVLCSTDVDVSAGGSWGRLQPRAVNLAPVSCGSEALAAMAAPTCVSLGPACALRMSLLMTTHTFREAVASDRDWLADCAVAMALETEHKRL